MKKLMLIMSITLSITLLSVSTSFAAVVYDDLSKSYFSTNEDDGTLCFGGTILNKNNTTPGINDSTLYLENLVPTDASFDGNPVEPSKEENINYSETQTSYTYSYVPDKKYFMIGLDNVDSSKFNIEISDAESGKLLSRGYNLDSLKNYKMSLNVADRNLCIKYTVSNNSLRNAPVLTFGDSNSMEAEIANIPPIITPFVSSSSVPKNVDGNQGKFIGYYTTEGTASDPASVYIRTKFSSSSDGMTSINLGWEDEYGIDAGYVLNLSKGSSFKSWAVSVGKEYSLRASTNSAKGKQATMSISETLY